MALLPIDIVWKPERNLRKHEDQSQTYELDHHELHHAKINVFDRQEFYSGMVAIAVPVTDASGHYYAALACHGPIQRFNLADAQACHNLLLTASREISAILFGPSANAP